jgi:tetratricopeptide (TPR) repeat protein
VNPRVTDSGQDERGRALAITDEQKPILLAFLEEKDCKEWIEKWLIDDWGLKPLYVKVAVRTLVPALRKLAEGTMERGFERIHEALSEKFEFYDRLSGRIGKWLCFKIENRRAAKESLSKWTDNPPAGMTEDQWKTVNEQTKVWLKEFEKLDAIALALGDLKCRVSLQIDEPELNANTPINRLLKPYNGFIPLIGREEDSQRLKSFCNHKSPFRWAVLTGDGGVGKTRLALETAKKRREEGWDAGFLSAGPLEHLVHHDGFSQWTPIIDSLIVVDYAASKSEGLKRLLERFGEWERENPHSEERVRLLLLERNADAGAGWLHDLRTLSAEGALRDRIQDAMEEAREIDPPGRKTPDETMVEILRATFKAWEKLGKGLAPDLPELNPDERRELRRNTEGRPLFLQMAGLRACEEGDASRLSRWGQQELLEDAVERELRYVERMLGSADSSRTKLAERGMAMLTFTGPVEQNDKRWLRLLAADAEACGYSMDHGETRDDVITILGNTKQGEKRQIVPLAPDLLAEAFSIKVLKEKPSLAVETLGRTLELAGPVVWSNLLRTTVDSASFGQKDSVDKWLGSLVKGLSLTGLGAAAALLPDASVGAATTAVAIYESMKGKLPENSEADAEKARVLNNLGRWYSAVGRREEARGAATQATEIYERLAARNPDSLEPELATSLNNVGAFYGDLGRPEEALNAAKRATEMYERLAVRNPDAFEPNLAMSLINLAIGYRRVGKREEALESAKRAAEIYERLAARDADAFEPHMATSLNNLGVFYSELGRREEALEATERSLQIRERLVARNADAFEPTLVGSLNNMGNRLSELSRREEALEAAQRATEICERLTARNPDAFEPDLATSLNNLGNRYSDLGRREEALRAAGRAVQIRERLAARNADAFEPDLATSLNNLGNRYSDLGRREEALRAAERATEIFERLATRNPDAFEPDLARSLGSSGKICMRDQPKKATKLFRRGIETLLRLFLSQPKAFGTLMRGLTEGYRKACETAGEEPDSTLVKPILKALENGN